MMQCAIWLIPRNILEKSGLWDERLSLINDYEFFIRVLLHAKAVRYTRGAKLYYRSGVSNSLSRTKSRKALESAFLSVSLGTRWLLQAENSERTRRVSADVFQVWAYNFFPSCLDLCLKAEEAVKTLGGSKVRISGGRVLKLLTGICGWKTAKFIQNTFYRFGYLKFLKHANSHYH